MNRDPSEPAERARQRLDRAAAELFTAAASDRAPAALRAALLARSQREARKARLGRWRSAPSLWLGLGAAAALLAAVVGWSAWRDMPRVAPLISAERLPAREPRSAGNEATEQTAPATADVATTPPAREARNPSGRTQANAAHPDRGSAARAAVATPRAAARQDVSPIAAPSIEPIAAAPATPIAAPPDSPRVTPVAPTEPSIAVQLAQLEQIRGALRGGENARALALLDAYERASQGGEFSAEARLMRIEALAGARRTAEARALAEDFLSRYPNSPLADRARRIAVGSAPGAR